MKQCKQLCASVDCMHACVISTLYLPSIVHDCFQALAPACVNCKSVLMILFIVMYFHIHVPIHLQLSICSYSGHMTNASTVVKTEFNIILLCSMALCFVCQPGNFETTSFPHLSHHTPPSSLVELSDIPSRKPCSSQLVLIQGFLPFINHTNHHIQKLCVGGFNCVLPLYASAPLLLPQSGTQLSPKIGSIFSVICCKIRDYCISGRNEWMNKFYWLV